MTTEEGERGQRDAYAQNPVAQNFSEVFNTDLGCFSLQLPSMTGGVVVAEALGYDHASCTIDEGEDVVAAWVHNDQRSQRWGLYTGLLVELCRGLAGTCAQPVENGNALGD